jgi:hypothetical protein
VYVLAAYKYSTSAEDLGPKGLLTKSLSAISTGALTANTTFGAIILKTYNPHA